MKKMSLSGKIKLAFARMSKYEIFVWVYIIFYYVILFLDNRKDPDLAEPVGSAIGIAAALLYMFIISNCFSSLKFFKTFPMTSEDVIDVCIFELVVRMIFLSAGNSMLMLICRLPEIIPYIICMLMAMAAVSSLLIPLYLKTESLRIPKPAEDRKKERKDFIKVLIVLLLYFILQLVISIFTLKFAFASESLAGDMGILAAVFAASIIILILTAKICGKNSHVEAR